MITLLFYDVEGEEMKIRTNNNISKDFAGRQISFLPMIDFYWNDETYAIIVGWLIGSIEFWFGDTTEIQ